MNLQYPCLYIQGSWDLRSMPLGQALPQSMCLSVCLLPPTHLSLYLSVHQSTRSCVPIFISITPGKPSPLVKSQGPLPSSLPTDRISKEQDRRRDPRGKVSNDEQRRALTARRGDALAAMAYGISCISWHPESSCRVQQRHRE